MDEAPLRRGAPSANARWDNTVAILTGDFLFARAADIAADLGTDIVRLQARTFERLCTGQIRETVGPAEGEDPVEHHLDVLADKTGSLIAAAGRIGAMTSGAGRSRSTCAISAYGEKFGVAFQLSDDLLDIASESEESGKTPGTDLREGIRTLPGAARPARAPTPPSARLRELLAGPLDRRRPARRGARACCAARRRWPRRTPSWSAGPSPPAPSSRRSRRAADRRPQPDVRRRRRPQRLTPVLGRRCRGPGRTQCVRRVR